MSAYDDLVPSPGVWPAVGDGLWSVWLIRSGRAVVEWTGGNLQAVTGQWVVIPPDFLRAQRFTRGSHIVSVRFVAAWPHGRSLFASRSPLLVVDDSWRPLEAPAVHLARLVGEGDRQEGIAGWRDRRMTLDRRWDQAATFATFLATWYRLVLAAGFEPVAPGPDDPRLAVALDLLANHRGLGPVPYGSLLSAVGLSRVHFDRVFFRALGATPRAWLERRCLEESRRLLGEPDLPIKAIAAQLHFTDASHFCRWYRSRTGVSPGKARRQPVDRV